MSDDDLHPSLRNIIEQESLNTLVTWSGFIDLS